MKWILVQPNYGGLGIGAMNVLRTPPEAILVYKKLEKICASYFEYIKDLNIPIIRLEDPLEDEVDLDHFQFLSETDEEAFNKLSLNDIDMVLSCPKCSGLSLMTIDAQRTDKVNNYIRQIVRASINVIKPKYILAENGYLIVNEIGKYVRQSIEETAIPAGYGVSYIVENAINYGVPQSRKRCIVILNQGNCPIYEDKHLKKVNLTKFFESYPPREDDAKYTEALMNEAYVKYAVEKLGDNWMDILATRAGRFARSFDSADIEAVRKYMTGESLEKKHARMVDNRAQGRGWYETSDLKVNKEFVGALISKSFGRDINHVNKRRLNLRDGHRLMGMPEDFPYHESKLQRKYCGRNVVVQVAQYFVEQMKKGIEGELPISDKKIQILDFT